MEHLAQLGAGVNMDELGARFEEWLSEPHPHEVSAEELEVSHRRKVAEENRAAIERLVGFQRMEPAERDLTGAQQPTARPKGVIK